MDIKGIIPPMVTPFRNDESIDTDRLKREVLRLRSAGVHGLSFGGSTGEGAVLSDDEIFEGIRTVKSESGTDIPVVCGVIRNSTLQGISAACAAASAGADALMITPTFYYGSDAKGNASFYEDIFNAAKIPIIIYNVIQSNPIRSADIPLYKTQKGIIGIKQSVGGIHGLTDMILACKGRHGYKNAMNVYAAQDDALFLSFLCGADGAISAILTLFPDLFVELWQAVSSGDIHRAKEIHEKVLPVWREIEGPGFPGRLKTAMNFLGMDVGESRRPIPRTDSRTKAILQKRLLKYKSDIRP